MRASAFARLVSSAACVTAIACEPPSQPDPNAVESVRILQESVSLEVGEATGLTLLATTATGQQTVGRPVEWETSDASVATVSSSGVVTAVSVGRATIRAIIEGKRGSVEVTVEPIRPRDVRIVDAHFTQGVQPLDSLNGISLIRRKAAAVNVLVECVPACSVPVSLALRLYSEDGATLLYSDTTRTTSPPAESSSFESPSAQFLVPASRITGVLRWQIEVDPTLEVLGNDKANDLLPLSGTHQQPTVEVPPLKVKFVPVELTAYQDAAWITPEQVPEYMRLARSIYPLGDVSAVVGPAVQSPRVFFGNAATFVAGVMADVDAARWLNETDLETHWVGVLKRPPPPVVLSFGGMGYIPSSYLATGPGTRTSIAYQQGTWLFDMTSKEVVAHELGHNFGRWHSPCGGAPFPGAFPYAGGTIGGLGHDVFSWAAGLSGSAITIPASRGDVMGYCYPSWISDFTYQGVADFRAVTPNVMEAPAAPTRTIRISGKIGTDERIDIGSLQALDARPALPTGGRYRLRGIDAGGRDVFSYAFDPPRVSETTDRHFLFFIPLSSQIEADLERVQISGPTGSTITRTWQR